MQTVAVADGNCSDEAYNAFLARFVARFSDVIGAGVPLFTTNVEDLYAVYLGSFSEAQRPHFTCYACKQFLNRFGGLVTIAKDGSTATPLWDEIEAPDFYRATFAALSKAVRKAKVTGVFLSSDPVWGTPATGTWTHLHVKPTKSMLFKHAIQTAGQAMAEKREDFGTVNRALAEFDLGQIEQALSLLETEALYRSEKVAGPVRWLRDLYTARDAAPGNRRANIVWRAVATAPPGFCHPRSSMAGTLLDDIAAGMDFADVSKRFASKMHPLQYQRPLAAPAAQNIAQGEKIIAAMGAERSLLRRFAHVEEIEALWRPAEPVPAKPAKGGVFAHLTAKGQSACAPIVAPAQTMTWDKFNRTVLPTAEAIEFYTRSGRDNYAALMTAVDADAPPILQWDSAEKRNPFSWYVWHGGAPPEQFSIAANAWHKVSAVTLSPHMWFGGNSTHHAKAVMFVIADARETRTDSGAALFPETLKSELHAVRSTIEAYSRKASPENVADGSACGILGTAGNQQWNILLRVTTNGRPVQYKLDRWD